MKKVWVCGECGHTEISAIQLDATITKMPTKQYLVNGNFAHSWKC